MDYVLETEFGRVTVVLPMVLRLLRAVFIHQAGIPVAVLRLALRSPVGPHPQLRVPEPLRRIAPLRERLPGGGVLGFLGAGAILLASGRRLAGGVALAGGLRLAGGVLLAGGLRLAGDYGEGRYRRRD